MYLNQFTKLSALLFAGAFSMGLFTDACAQVGKLPVPPECSSTKTLTLPYANHPKKYTAYGKVDLYCGSSTKAIAKGVTFCNSDYNPARSDQKSVTIAVSTKAKSGKINSCSAGNDLKFVPE